MCHELVLVVDYQDDTVFGFSFSFSECAQPCIFRIKCHFHINMHMIGVKKFMNFVALILCIKERTASFSTM
jgi:hypothetical protein